MTDFAAPQPHGPLQPVFSDVFMVTGAYRVNAAIAFTRNMAVVRQGTDLIVLNSVRLSPEGEAALDALGTVRHVVRLGPFHGLDDPWYVHRYGATLWVPPRTKPGDGGAVRELGPGSCPIEGATVFTFEKARKPENALLLERDGGILLTCDAYQHWTSFAGCSLMVRMSSSMMGFGPTCIGPMWLKAMGNEVADDFRRLQQQPFRHLLPAHGSVLRDTAREGIAVALAKAKL